MTRSEGTGGGAEVAMTYAAQRDAEVAIAGAADDLDATGGQVPRGDFGEAGSVVALIVSAYADAASQLVTEGKVIALGMRVATGAMESTDSLQAVDFVELNRP